MRCSKVRLFMEEYQRGVLEGQVARKIEKHVHHCAECADLFAGERPFLDMLTQAVFPSEEFDDSADRMWSRVMARLRTEDIQSDKISPAFFRKAMAFSCAAVFLILALMFFVEREQRVETPIAPASPSCFRHISPQPGSRFESETLKLLDPAVHSMQDMRTFLSEMKRPARADFFTECYPQFPVIHAQPDHL